ncbi:MAG TPA: GGDEF domain-containing protein, partial [bacterium]|nr:GGDEF domain-containing protein [bacterium]
HDVGDAVLQMVANTLSSNIRSFDRVIRWGGEEFLVILVNIQDSDLPLIAEKIRVLVQKSFLKHQDISLSVTVSIGATLCRGDDTKESLLKRADSLMYDSKQANRNRVTIG